MRRPYWKAIASSSSSRLSTLKDSIAQRDLKGVRRELQPGEHGYIEGTSKKQSWSQWAAAAGQKIAKKVAGEEASASASTEKVLLFPGWASRRFYAESYAGPHGADILPYEIEVFTSGYAVKNRAPGILTRSQKTFVKLAKSFASLPKVNHVGGFGYEEMPMSRSTEALLATMELPPRPEEITAETELRALHSRNNSSATIFSSSSSSTTFPSPAPSQPPSPPELGPFSHSQLQRLHSNLEARLHPFWAAALPSRTVRISLYPAPTPDESPAGASRTSSEYQLFDAPLAVQQVLTSPEGAFQVKFRVPWEELCTHPRGVHIAFGEPAEEVEFVVAVELLPPPPPLNASAQVFYEHTIRPPVPTANAEERVPLTHSQVRVISDIDDTVKLSSVLGGARAVFYNVFVKDLRDNVIRGMGEWYGEMWRRGVRFHYVSNGPFELLPVINEFFQLAQLPAGSIRLRSYTTRSLFNGLLSAPAARKRAGVEDVLASFPNSKFILVGDSGEQDLELYASLARARPDQVVCIFVRDANTYDDGGPGISDPTGASMEDVALAPPEQPFAHPVGAGRRKSSTASSLMSGIKSGLGSAPPSPPLPTAPLRASLGSRPSSIVGNGDYFSQRSVSQDFDRDGTPVGAGEPASAYPSYPYMHASGSPTGSSSSLASGSGTPLGMRPSSMNQAGMTESEKKRYALQMRVWKARVETPPGVVLRVFREPEECVEAQEVLDRFAQGAEGGSS
ncbi:hypothetical protein OF83DRAFT_1059817 [Amylostereum chailletii]|nr:hypothetical protein OF83DRAFT_1059817 [Amylostereum chailletii]